MRVPVLLLCLSASVASLHAQEPAAPRVHDVRALTGRFDAPSGPMIVPPLLFAYGEYGGFLSDSEQFQVLDEGSIASMLQDVLSDGGRMTGTSIDFHDGHLFVRAPAAAQEKIVATIDALTRAFVQPLVVEVFGVTDRLAERCILGAADVDRVISEHPSSTLIARTSMIAGRTSRIRCGRNVNFLADYGIEVAEAASIADPRVRSLFEGCTIDVRVDFATDGRLVTRVAGSQGSLLAMVTRPVASTGIGDLQLPRVRSDVMVSSGILDDGGALLVGADGEGCRQWLVRVRRVDTGPTAPAGPAGAPSRAFVSTADISWAPVRVPRTPLLWSATSRDAGKLLTLGEAAAAFPVDRLASMLSSIGGETGSIRCDTYDNRIHARGTEAEVARVRAWLKSAAQQVAKNVTVEFRIGRIKPAEALALSAGRLAASDLAEKLPRGARAAVKMGDEFRVLSGVEEAVIVDQEVQIAQKVQMANPFVWPVFHGFQLDGVVSEPSAGRYSLDLEATWHEQEPDDARNVPTRSKDVGALDLPRIEVLQGRHEFSVEPGRWVIVAVLAGTRPEGPVALLARLNP